MGTMSARRLPDPRAFLGSGEPVQEGRLERQERRRRQILDAARELFALRGYHATSLRDIAARVELTHPALRRHFPSKEVLLDAVLTQLEAEETLRRARGDAGVRELGTVATSQPDDLLLIRLAGEASDPHHPAHARMADRYARRVTEATDDLRAAGIDTGSPPDLLDRATRLVAVADGARLYAGYVRDVDAADVAQRYWRESQTPLPDLPPVLAWPATVPTAFRSRPFPDPHVEIGYAVGRERRERIVSAAIDLFAQGGFANTSLSSVAERVGISKSSLLHHYPTKGDLLAAVLLERDHRMAGADRDTRDALDEVVAGAHFSAAEEPGLVELYATLSCEASAEDHPAHLYFAQRLAFAVEYFTALFDQAAHDGILPPERDAAHEGRTLAALWDGLQLGWLYARDQLDIARQLEEHLASVMPGWRPTARQLKSASGPES